MLVDEFKFAKPIPIAKSILDYISKHYDIIAFKEVEPLVNQLEIARNASISCFQMDKNYNNFLKSKDNIVAYLRLLNCFKQKMNFGTDEFNVKIGFVWGDSLTKDNYTSYNFAMEYYNHIYNLAITLVNIGKSVSLTDSDDKLKEAIKCMNQAAYLFDKIKLELPNSINSKEIQPDLSANYLSYASYYILANSQIIILEVCKKKKMALELQAQLSKGIYDNLTQAASLLTQNLKKYTDNATLILLNHKKYYYFALGLIKVKDFHVEEVSKIGKGFGKAICYMSMAVEALNAAAKDLKYLVKLIDVQEFENKFNKVKEDLEEMKRKNNKIYVESIPDASTLPKIEKKIMANPKPFDEDLTQRVEGTSILDKLVPHEVKPMVENYKRKMVEKISESLDKYENEGKMVSFLSGLGLPGALESVFSQNEISEYLYKTINKTQEKGGSMYLNNNLSNVDSTRDKIYQRIKDISNMLYNEEEEDNIYRMQYGQRWNRQPSKSLNANFLGNLTQFSAKLEIAKNCDAKIKENIMDNMKYFELLGLSKTSLEKKIPVKIDPNSIQTIPEAQSLREDLDKLDRLKDKNIERIEALFRTLNEENLVPQMLEVYKKKNLEDNVFKENYPKYEELLNEVAKLDPEITVLKKSIDEKNDVFLKVKASKIKPVPENEQFFRDLESYISLFNEKLNNLHQGLNFYNELNNRLDGLSGTVTDYLLSRDIEKSESMKSISGGSMSNPNQNQNNPNQIYNFTQQSGYNNNSGGGVNQQQRKYLLI